MQTATSCEIKWGHKIRIFGGWYKHDIILLDGKEIGRIQLRRRNKRYDTLTSYTGDHQPHACVLGADKGWVLRYHMTSRDAVPGEICAMPK